MNEIIDKLIPHKKMFYAFKAERSITFNLLLLLRDLTFLQVTIVLHYQKKRRVCHITTGRKKHRRPLPSAILII